MDVNIERYEQELSKRHEAAAWFVVANPKIYRWETAFKEGSVVWDGARSAIAQQNIRSCRPGDPVIAYQSSPEQEIVGLGEIAEPAAPFSHQQKNWFSVKIRMGRQFSPPFSIDEVRAVAPSLTHFNLAQPSFTPVSPAEWSALQELFKRGGGTPAPAETKESPPPEKSTRSSTPFRVFDTLKCTPTARAILNECVTLASSEEYPRWLSSGILLCACLEIGRQTSSRNDQNVAYWLTEVIDADAFARARENYFDRHRGRKRGALPPRSLDFVSNHFVEVVNEAKRLAGEEEVGARHLIVALLSVGKPAQPPSSWRLLYAAGGDRHRLLRDLLDGLVERGYEGEREAWIRERRSLANITAVIAGYSADAPSGEDCLNLDGDVMAMASLIVARAVEPPLAVGVFGPWGSGKSFFLRRLRETIAKAAQSADAHYWPNIVQIEFNAWHYVDANLWASLTAHILQQLSVRTKPGIGELAQQEACRAALALLQLADERLKNADVQVAKLTQEVAAAATKTADKIAEIKSDETKLAAEVARNLVAEIDVPAMVKGIPGAEAALADLATIDSAWKSTATTGQDLRQRLDNLTKTGTRLDLLWTALLNGHSFWRKATPWFFFVAGLVAVAWFLFGPWIQQHVFAELLSVLAPAATAAAGLAKWVSSQHKRITALLDPLEKVRKNIDAQIAAAEAARQQRIGALEASLAAKRAELNQATSAKAEAEKAMVAAKQAASDAVSGKTIDAFVAQRVGSGEYQKHLGLVALVRNDFEKLGNMILTHNGIQGGTREEAVVAALKEKGVEIENLGINRIVLYIDDLDRCPSPRVVEVLQAIHLLLAFPVFVVVVAVDSRWMKRALAQEYPLLVGSLAAETNGNGHGSSSLALPFATPEDYLEKIFQIPYWLPPMSASACGRLMRSLTTSPDERKKASGAKETPVETRSGNEAEPRAENPNPAVPRPAAPMEKSPAPDHNDEQDESDASEPAYDENPPVPSAERLQLGRGEATGMEQLALLVGRSPRAAKRFVNTYRVIRASLSASQLERMEAQRSHDAILFLLALTTGAPVLTHAFEAKRSSETNGRASITTLLTDVANDMLEASPSAADREAALRAKQWAEKADHRWTSLTRQRLDEWAPRVRRFSFAGDDEASEISMRRRQKSETEEVGEESSSA